MKSIVMPQVGQDIETATLIEWHVKENDFVNKGDIIATVDSDKATFEVETYETGTIIKLLYEENEEVRIFEPIAYIGEPGEFYEVPKDKEEKIEDYQEEFVESSEEKKVGLTDKPKTKILASPSAKKVASIYNISLESVVGSGPDGRIVKDDVLNLVNNTEQQSQLPNITVEKFTKMRQKISDRMVQSKQTIPHFYLFSDVDITEALQKREKYNESAEIKISINDMIINAVANALAQFPLFNSHVSDFEINLLRDINIGVVVSVEEGLLVPIIPDADKKNLAEIATASKKIIEDAKNGIISDSRPASFTISNLGMFDINKFLPIINPPECAILGVGRAEKRVVPAEYNTINFRDILTLSLACDHRGVDGVYGAKFLEKLKGNLEQIQI